jgi:hypothetical protein
LWGNGNESTTVMFICSVMVVLSFMGMLIVQDVIELPTIDVPIVVVLMN